jgi:hypothetical protein
MLIPFSLGSMWLSLGSWHLGSRDWQSVGLRSILVLRSGHEPPKKLEFASVMKQLANLQ